MSDSQYTYQELQKRLEISSKMLEQASLIVLVARTVIETLRQGGKLLLFGNGGSAADAQHVAAEFINRFLLEREALPAISLTTDTSVLTSIGNDRSFEDVFARQIAALGHKNDLAIGISTSGNSANVLKGLEAAKTKGIKTVGFSGNNGGSLKNIVDQCFLSPSNKTPLIQETHIVAWHIICDLVERELNAQHDSTLSV